MNKQNHKIEDFSQDIILNNELLILENSQEIQDFIKKIDLSKKSILPNKNGLEKVFEQIRDQEKNKVNYWEITKNWLRSFKVGLTVAGFVLVLATAVYFMPNNEVKNQAQLVSNQEAVDNYLKEVNQIYQTDYSLYQKEDNDIVLINADTSMLNNYIYDGGF